ncbi:MAG: hypothetical protein R2939_01115 [Kofleriaceae bacterium]
MTRPGWVALVAALAALTLGCRGDPPAEPGAAAPAAAPRPAGLSLPRLDDPHHELRVLGEELALWRGRLALDPANARVLVERLLRRASVEGRLEDYVEADARSAAWLAAAPTDRRAMLTRATVALRLHRLAEARAVLAQARAAGTSADEIAPLEAAIAQADGAADHALPFFEEAARLAPSAGNLSAFAAALADDGQPAAALPLLARAWAQLTGPAPLPAAALLFLWGRVHEQLGQLREATLRYELALRAVPQHLEARAHLAGLLAVTGERERAIELLDAPRDAGAHPELTGQLAAWLAGRDPTRAASLEAEAARAWTRWVEALPEAFADHAARFLLTARTTRDPARALALAKLNRAARATVEADLLLLEAATAADDVETLCATRAALNRQRHLPAAAQGAVERAASRCP